MAMNSKIKKLRNCGKIVLNGEHPSTKNIKCQPSKPNGFAAGLPAFQPRSSTMNTRKIVITFLLLHSGLLISGCNQPQPEINQHDLCVVKEWEKEVTAAECKPGQKVVFLPSSWGNAQLPIMFAAVNCDHRFSIALTNGGVSCIYTPLIPEPAANK